MSHWQPIDTLNAMTAFASELDFTRCEGPATTRLTEDQLIAYLKLLTLFSGRVLIPESFLLHNRTVQRILSCPERRKDSAVFLKEGGVTITGADAKWNGSFVEHWDASRVTAHPSLISAAEGGEQYAHFLDDLGLEQSSYAYATRANRQFPQEFERELLALRIPKTIRD